MIKQLRKRVLNGLALGYKPSDIPKFLMVKSGLTYLFRNETIYSSYNCEEIFLKANIVSLNFRCDRRRKIEAELKVAKIPYTFHDAVYGRDIEINQTLTNQFSKQSIKYLSIGSIGAIISHYQLWLTLLNSELKIHLIFEDDVNVSPNLIDKIRDLSLASRDFDIIYLGNGTKKAFNFQASEGEIVFKPFFPRRGLYAYIITNNGIIKIMEHLFPIKITCGGLDTIVGNLVRKNIIKGLQAYPDICSVDYNSPSNIYNFSDSKKKLHEMELKWLLQ